MYPLLLSVLTAGLVLATTNAFQRSGDDAKKPGTGRWRGIRPTATHCRSHR